MGFLDHSTNNIIVDAVLTDYGREQLSKNTNTSNLITMYGFADDEVDYTMIKKYGLIVGKEKIEKNTPIFEASTNAEYGVEYYIYTTLNPLQAQSAMSVSNSSNNETVANQLTNDTDVQKYAISFVDSDSTPTISVSFDNRFLNLIGAISKQSHDTNPNRSIASIETQSYTFEFKRGTAGQDVLESRSTTSEMTQVTFSTNEGHIFHQTIEVKY